MSISELSGIDVSVAVTMETAWLAQHFTSTLQVVCLLDGGLEFVEDAPCAQQHPGSDQVACKCGFNPGQGGVHSIVAFAVVRGEPSATMLGRPLYVRTPPVPPASVHEDQRAPKRATSATTRGVPGPRRLPVGVYFSTIFGNGAAVWQNMTETLGHNPLTVESALTSGSKFQVCIHDAYVEPAALTICDRLCHVGHRRVVCESHVPTGFSQSDGLVAAYACCSAGVVSMVLLLPPEGRRGSSYAALPQHIGACGASGGSTSSGWSRLRAP